MQRRGISHLEIVISFVLFIVVVSFLISFFDPTNTISFAKETNEYIARAVLANVSIQSDVYSLFIHAANIPVNETNISVELNDSISLRGVYVEQTNGVPLPSARDTGKIVILWNGTYAATIFVSDAFASQTASYVPAVNATYYTLGSAYTRTFLSEESLNRLNASYYANYSSLKKQFAIPNRVDFGFSARVGDMVYKAMRPRPPDADVATYSTWEEILTANGSRVFGEVLVETW